MTAVKIDVSVTDNTAELLQALHSQCAEVLTEIGGKAKKYARDELKQAERVETGALRDSIDFAVGEDTVIVGTDNDYAPHHELGTGHYTKPHASENYGISAVHFLRNAFAKHLKEFERMMTDAMKKGG